MAFGLKNQLKQQQAGVDAQLFAQEELAKQNQVAALRDRVGMRTDYLMRVFGARRGSGGRPPILGF